MRITGRLLFSIAATVLVAGCQTAQPAPSTPVQASPVRSTPVLTTPVASGFDGTFLYYRAQPSSRLVRLSGTNTRTVLSGTPAWAAELSPDGRSISYVSDDGILMAGPVGGKARKLRSGVVTVGYGPAWTGDGRSVMVAVSEGDRWVPGTVRIDGGRFTPLPASLSEGIHHRPTPDGSRVFWSDGRCAILSGRADGTDVRQVPVLGLDADSSENPRRLRACDIVSLNPDGSRMTVDLHRGNDTDGDIGGSQAASAVVDTATGRALRLPISGEVRQALYRADGTLVVRTVAGGKGRLILLSAGLEVLAERDEPALSAELNLHDAA